MNRYMVPIWPQQADIKSIYPWNDNEIIILYERAIDTGFVGTLEEFKETLGKFFNLISKLDIYTGQYIVTPLPEMEQILRTKDLLLQQDVIVEKIPFYKTTNNVGGYTVFIG